MADFFTPPIQSNQTLGLYASSNTILTSSATLDARSLSMRGAGIVSVGNSAGEFVISATAGAAGVQSLNASTGAMSISGASNITASNNNSTITVYGPANILNSWSIGGNTGTTNSSNITGGGWVLAGGSNISLSQSNATISIHAAAAGGDAIRGIAANGSTASTNTVNFSNSNGISFGFGAAGNSTVITASHNALTSQSTQYNAITLGGNTAGTTSFNATDNNTIFLHGGNNITLSGSGSSITISAANAGAGNPASFFNNIDVVNNTSAFQVSGSTKHLQPLILPYDISVSFVRFPVTMSAAGSQAATATAANQTRGMTMSSTMFVVVYSQGVGANSRSLQSYASGSASWIQRATLQAGATGSHWSSGHTVSFPREGGNTDFTSSAGATSASYTVQSSQLSNFTGLRFLDVPFATSLSAGNYWLAYGSSSSLSTSGNANMSTLRILASNFVATQVNQAINLLGSATNSSNQFILGLGSYTTNQIQTTASIALANISTSASHPQLFFQMIRQA